MMLFRLVMKGNRSTHDPGWSPLLPPIQLGDGGADPGQRNLCENQQNLGSRWSVRNGQERYRRRPGRMDPELSRCRVRRSPLRR